MRKIRYIWRKLSDPDRTTSDNSQVVGQLHTKTQIDSFISRVKPNRTGRLEDKSLTSRLRMQTAHVRRATSQSPEKSASTHTHKGVQMEDTTVAPPVLGPTRCSKIDGITHLQVLLRVYTPSKLGNKFSSTNLHISVHTVTG